MRLGDCQLDSFLEPEIPDDAKELDYSEAYSAFDRSFQRRMSICTI